MKLTSYPHLVKEWHPTKNGELTPNDFTHGIEKNVWWLCPKGHSYEATPNHRTQKTYPHGCPYCSGRRVGEDNNLLFLFPEIAKEWHPTKNKGLSPEDFTYGSHKEVWWLCPSGHAYEASLSNRAFGTGCPYCSGNRVNSENSLAAKRPDLVAEWHPTKNGQLTPHDVTAGSDKVVFWQCARGHVWERSVHHRKRIKGIGCPECRTLSDGNAVDRE